MSNPDSESERKTYQLKLDTDENEPATDIAEAVAEIEHKESVDLAPIYGCVDGILDHLFDDPPNPQADLRVSFDYEGYHVVIHQDGSAAIQPIQ